MAQKIINFNFSAPYYTRGSLTPNTRQIWLIFHGYGQLANEFAGLFSSLASEENYLIFPQGLSKFYLKGIDNKIGTNWMTSLDREIDIKNYTTYLDLIFEHEIKPNAEKAALNILGFSQGGHTASRWIYHSAITYNKLILWGTTLAHEIDSMIIRSSFSSGGNFVVLGDQDKYIKEEQLGIIKKRYQKIGFNYELLQYHGGHDIYPEILNRII